MTLRQKLETLPPDMYVEVQTNRRGEFFCGVASEILAERSNEVLGGDVLRSDLYEEAFRGTICDMFVALCN